MMKIRLRFGKYAALWKTIVITTALGLTASAGLLACSYYKYSELVDSRLSEPLFLNATQIYAAPREMRVGQAATPWSIIQELQRAGYTEAGSGKTSPLGTYRILDQAVTVSPGPRSYHSPEPATLVFADGRLSRITDVSGESMETYELEPILMTPMADETRGKRRLVHYDELPQHLVQAVLAIEDRRFYSHRGIDYVRVLGAIRNDLRHGWVREGASTLTMQLARGFFLSPEKKMKRKLIEIMIAHRLEQRLDKRQIFEMYVNQINLGQWGSFSINGVGEAAHCYFGKEVQELNLAESATLAGLIQRPSRLSPFRHPEGILRRRNLVLDAMAETGAISQAKAERAKAEPLRLSWNSINAGEAPYFADLVEDQLEAEFGEGEFSHEGLRVYTSLDADLQREATEAVAAGMKLVDERLQTSSVAVRRKNNTMTEVATRPQVALIALDPRTGRVLALVGGRDYGVSQFNHAISQRPTGSIFKPFVYAAAFEAGLSGRFDGGAFTPTFILNDERQTFGRGYSPRNYHGQYHGDVTAQYALAHSLNNATLELAREVGFDKVADLARAAGVKSAQGTPAVALGAYAASPLQMAGAYTVFANDGVRMEPSVISSIRTAEGDVIEGRAPAGKPVLDPRASYLTLSLMQNVIEHGTGQEVRRRGFLAPAAGKTGTSHDAWFAGFTSNLLCIIWVGNDDYSDIKLAGGQAAAPIWAEFMKRAVRLPQYADTEEFEVSEGVTRVWLDAATNRPSEPETGEGFYAAFVAGTEPK